MNTPPPPEISTAIGIATGRHFEVAALAPAAGGCINQNFTLVGRDGRRYFVKLNSVDRSDMFSAEAEGLDTLAAAHAIRVPRPIAHGTTAEQSYLVLEWLDLGGRDSGTELGQRLAGLHRTTWHAFGWSRDNTIGATPQDNTPETDWIEFYRQRRLRVQLGLALRRGASGTLIDRGERLLDALADYFPGYRPQPSLLHGDLWSGNFGHTPEGPVLFDPAVYFGDREADLAMTELFGGFPADFHHAYREAWPLDPGYAIRKSLYNLYHVLNHYHLFGGGYAQQALRMIHGLLAARN